MSVSYSASEPLPEDTIARLQRRLERERLSRKQAEALLEEKSRELFALNQRLANLADDLEIRVQARTSELESERERALVVSRLDQLTGLANRGCFTSYLEDICRVDIAYRKSLSLFFIDIDNFKIINDTMGHEAGDVVLRDLSARLVTLLPAGGIAARIGGDEFAIICQRLESREAVAVQAEILLDALRAPVMYRGKPVNVSCSIGVARLPDDAGNAADLQRFADMALYASKRAGRSSATVFQDSLRREAEERHALERELEAAIEAGEIIPWFQPIYNAASGSMSGVEVLARWAHPQRGVLSPLHFLPLAEERGLMDAMFRSIMRRACALCWPLVKNGHLRYVSLNVSPSQFLREPMAETVAELLAEAHFPASSLVIEITEEVLMGDVRQVGRELEALSNTGVRIALDDFGTGYSNIASLRTLPIDWLKLDRSLIRDIVDVPASRAIVRAVLQMCDALTLEIVAEGVETPDQAAWLIRAGCQRLQGYHYGRPVPFDLLFENTSRSI